VVFLQYFGLNRFDGNLGAAHWAETDYGLSAGQHAVLPEGKGKCKGLIENAATLQQLAAEE